MDEVCQISQKENRLPAVLFRYMHICTLYSFVTMGMIMGLRFVVL